MNSNIPRFVPHLAVAFSTVGAWPLLTATSPSCCEQTAADPSSKLHRSKLFFLGTGSSTGCPRPLCPMIFRSGNHDTPELKQLRQQMKSHCKVSNLALEGDPKTNKNYRNNPSLVISKCDDENAGPCTNVVIDVGKTFREGALRWFPDAGISSLDAIVLTHAHMDAAGGLDDVRGFQKWKGLYEPKKGETKRPVAVPVPVYLSQSCLEDVAERFPWLFPHHQPKPKKVDPDKPFVQRHVATLDVHIFEPFEPIHVHGIEIIPLPVMHGEDLVSFGYAFTVHGTSVVYLSDISRMLPETLEYIQTKLPPTDILVLDALHMKRDNPVHYSLPQAVALSKIINPKQTYLLGMNCDSFHPHDESNEMLRRDHGNIQLAHDGLTIDLTR